MSKSPLHRHLPFLLGFAAGIAMSIILWIVHPKAALVGGAITFFLFYLIHTGDPAALSHRRQVEDLRAERR